MAKTPNGKKEDAELDRYEKLVGQARDEITWIRSVYQWIFGGITVLFLFGVALAVIFIGKDLREIKSRLNNEVDIVGRRVIDRIDKEFKEENIQELIVKQVDAVAGQLISDKVKEKVDPEIEKIGIELKALNEKTNKLQSKFAIIINDQKLLVEKFAYDQSKKMTKINNSITKQQKLIDQLVTAANTQIEKLGEMIKLAEPPELRLSSQPTIQKVEEGYELELKFDSPKDKYLGTIAFEVQVVDASAAKILKLSRTGISMNVKHTIEKNGKKAIFQYSPLGSGLQQIKIQVSGTCKLLIFGNYLAKPVNIVVK